jgi:hypothetical protein
MLTIESKDGHKTLKVSGYQRKIHFQLFAVGCRGLRGKRKGGRGMLNSKAHTILNKR